MPPLPAIIARPGGAAIARRDLASTATPLRHDPDKLADALIALATARAGLGAAARAAEPRVAAAV